jgi:DnaK suppressor protein
MDDRLQVNPERTRERLLAQRAALVRLMEANMAGDAPEPDKTRSGRLTRLDDLQNEAMSAESVRRRKLQLVRIDAALRRLEEGDYGFCSGCGNPIAPGRLGVDPAADQCIRCATSAEQGAGPQIKAHGRP